MIQITYRNEQNHIIGNHTLFMARPSIQAFRRLAVRNMPDNAKRAELQETQEFKAYEGGVWVKHTVTDCFDSQYVVEL